MAIPDATSGYWPLPVFRPAVSVKPMKLGKALVLVGAFLTIIVLAAKFWFLPNIRRVSEDKSIASYQIAAAFDQYLLENSDRVFVQYDDLIGPDKYVKAVFPAAGEDYHELFPLRIDYAALGVTMDDGRRVIVFTPPEPVKGITRFTLRQKPNGQIMDSDGREAYLRWLEAERKPDGVQVKKLENGRRFETTYRGGIPDGPFRAYYEGGELWAEATYIKGRPVGPHVIYARNGKRIYETTFAASRK